MTEIKLAFLQVALVGGQDAADVTTTADAAGGFETHFFHKLYQEECGRVRGHFGPVNSVAISPDGKSFTTGGEDGFVRMQHFDMVCSCPALRILMHHNNVPAGPVCICLLAPLNPT